MLIHQLGSSSGLWQRTHGGLKPEKLWLAPTLVPALSSCLAKVRSRGYRYGRVTFHLRDIFSTQL